MTFREKAKAATGTRPPYKIFVTELNTDVWVKCPSYGQIIELQTSLFGGTANISTLPKIIAQLLCDESGTLIYDPKSKSDLAELADIDQPVFESLFNQLCEAISTNEKKVKDAKKK